MTYFTEPGIIPKGKPLTIDQIQKLTDTPRMILTKLSFLEQCMLRQLFLYINNEKHDAFQVCSVSIITFYL